MATRNTDVERARQAGARRRALLEGRPLPPEPDPPAPPAPTAGGHDTEPSTDAAATADTSPGADTAQAAETSDTPAPTPAARGPWFDARAFFLGWLAMAIAFFAGASGFLVAMIGFAAGYFFARRSRITNALVAVAGGTVATVLLTVLLALALAAFSG